MKFLTTIGLSLFICLAFINNAKCQNKSLQSLPTQSQTTTDFIERFNKPEHINLLQSGLWTVTHDYADFKHMQEVLNTFQSYFNALGKYKSGDAASLEKLGGIKSLKDKAAEWLKDDDQAIRAFAAVIIGISGDKTYAPQLAVLLKDRKYEKEPLIIYDRSRAAMALGLIGAKEFMPQIIPLLQSKNEYDRTGAISALGYFGAKEYSKEVAGLLINKDFQFDDDSSPIFFLVEMGTAKDYKKELVQVMLGDFRSEMRVSAMYALVNLNARETAPDIAKQLKGEFTKSDAAKALALLGAKEFIEEIALLLKDENSLVRSAAALALGVLKDTKYAAQVAKLFDDKANFVHNYAATALIMMEATDFYKISIPLIAEGAFLTSSEFHPLVAEQTHKITEDLKKSFEKAKTFSANQR